MEPDKKRIIESALFISARSMALDELARLTGLAAPGFVKAMLEELRAEYEGRGSAVEIMEIDGRWLMRVKDAYAEKVKGFAQQAEVSRPALRTLAYIARHDGVMKSEVANKIGAQIYEDVRELAQSGFVKQVKAGRSKRLFLTDKFKQYFRTVQTEGQTQLEQKAPQQQ
ncbi:Segregation and condensation protein B [uncultured archaeon]|nr:Segregation and condensation protein B [uncultured archaeon]